MTAGRRNVLLITADQWRGDSLGCAGHPVVRTPNLDRLADQGVRFARHYANASPCGPSRACLLTGMYLQNHRSVRNGTPLDARFTNLALEARKAGYAPALFGYTDTSPDPRRHPSGDPALRSYEGVMPGFEPVCPLLESIEPWAEHLRARGYAVPRPAPDIYRPRPDHPDGPWAPAVYRAADSDTAYLTNRVLAWLENRDGAPWFAHVSYLRPHPPWVAPAPYHGLYDPAAVPPPVRAASAAAEAAQHPWLAWRLASLGTDNWVRGARLDPRTLAGADLGRLRATYYALITEVDHHIGRLLDHLEATGQADDTLVVVTSDHGEMLGDHWMLGKESYFDAAFHIPLIVRDPTAARGHGRVVAAFTESVDVMPTILDWLGLEVPAQCDGRSLRPFLHGADPADWRRGAHWELDFRDVVTAAPERALGLGHAQCTLNVLRGERYKYVHFAALPPLLFDLAADPGEFRNLADDPAHVAVVRDCAQALLSWHMAHAERTLANLCLTPDGVVAGK